jgi:hypothetical protein
MWRYGSQVVEQESVGEQHLEAVKRGMHLLGEVKFSLGTLMLGKGAAGIPGERLFNVSHWMFLGPSISWQLATSQLKIFCVIFFFFMFLCSKKKKTFVRLGGSLKICVEQQ